MYTHAQLPYFNEGGTNQMPLKQHVYLQQRNFELSKRK